MIRHLVPRRPSDAWQGRAEFLTTLSPGTAATALPAPISTLRTWNRIAASGSGPLRPERVGVVLGFSHNGATEFDRADPTELRAQQTGLFATMRVTPSAANELLGV